MLETYKMFRVWLVDLLHRSTKYYSIDPDPNNLFVWTLLNDWANASSVTSPV